MHGAAAARSRIVQQAHLAEVDLTLHAGFTVGHPHRLAAAAEPAVLHAEPVQRPVRHHHTPPLQQGADLHHRQTRADPLGDLLPLRLQLLPGAAVPGRAVRAHRRHHRADHLVGDLRPAALADHARGLGGLHVAPRGLPVHTGLLGHDPQPGTAEPAAQHLTNFDH